MPNHQGRAGQGLEPRASDPTVPGSLTTGSMPPAKPNSNHDTINQALPCTKRRTTVVTVILSTALYIPQRKQLWPKK